MSATVMIVVTHLLGTGHLARALTLGRAFSTKGKNVHVVSGGFPVPQFNSDGVMLHQLPPLRANGTDFSILLGANDMPFTAQDHAARQAQLLDLLEKIAPDILITELFPFGRRNLRAEFTALLEVVGPETRAFCSVRDVLAPPSKPAKAALAADLINAHYDAILVHSDPAILPLSRSWPVPDSMVPKLRYTGFVAPPPIARGNPVDEIIVSAGGGNVGQYLFDTALDAAIENRWRWRLLVGTEGDVESLRARAPDNVIVERARRDFRKLLASATASVSMCGYNTAMDILQTGVPAVIVPFDAGNETEQTLRAQALSGLDGLSVVSAQDLTGPTLLMALDQVLSAPARDAHHLRFDGAEETVRICMEHVS